jgi:hypothetical protein
MAVASTTPAQVRVELTTACSRTARPRGSGR